MPAHTNTEDRRKSLARRGQIGHLMREIDALQVISASEVVLILRALNLAFVKYETNESLLAAVARPLNGCATEIEEWSRFAATNDKPA